MAAAVFVRSVCTHWRSTGPLEADKAERHSTEPLEEATPSGARGRKFPLVGGCSTWLHCSVLRAAPCVDVQLQAACLTHCLPAADYSCTRLTPNATVVLVLGGVLVRRTPTRYSRVLFMSTTRTRLFTSQRAARVHRSDEGALSKSRDQNENETKRSLSCSTTQLFYARRSRALFSAHR